MSQYFKHLCKNLLSQSQTEAIPERFVHSHLIETNFNYIAIAITFDDSFANEFNFDNWKNEFDFV